MQVMPPLDAATEAALRHSIQRFGVIVPIVVTVGGEVVDGHHRQHLATELGVDCPKVVTESDDLQELAVSLNNDRRHMDPEQRRAIVADLRAEGHSQRAIAGAVGVSQVQVRRDLQVSPPGSPDVDVDDSDEFAPDPLEPMWPDGSRIDLGDFTDASPPKRVTGTDGKSYPSQRAPQPRKPSTTKAVALALYKLADAAEAFEAIDRRKLAEYASEVPVWSGNLAESMKAIGAFSERLKEISE